MEQDKVTKLSSQKNVWDEDSDRRNTMTQDKKKLSLGQRWHEAQPTKMVVFWACIASIILTMIVGFSFGGWMTTGTAQEMAKVPSACPPVREWTWCAARWYDTNLYVNILLSQHEFHPRI